MNKLLENEYIKKYLELLKINFYVQISDESLRIQSVVLDKIKLYNEDKIGFDRISLNKEKYTVSYIKQYVDSEYDKKVLTDIEVLLSLKSIFLEMDIYEQSFSQKRNAIVKALRNERKENVDLLCGDILYFPEKIKMIEINSLKSYNEMYNKYITIDLSVNKMIYFRGQANINWEIKPSIFRGDWINHEKDFIEEMIIRNPSDFDNCRTTIEKLTKMQHYNAPTRLLDLTKNRLIALYFACEKSTTEVGKPHGEIAMFSDNSSHIYYYDGDTVSMIANIAMMDTSFDFSNLDKLNYQIKQDKLNFDEIWDIKYLQQCVITHVKLDNKRIMNQQGLFLLVGMGADRLQHADINSYLVKDTLGKKILFVVPYKHKAKILNELDQININKGFVYPEIDHVADYLKSAVFKQ